METKIIIVDSVKGGCGKTTISLKNVIRAFEESTEENGKKENPKTKVCLVDFDLLGSSIETFLTGKTTDFLENDSNANQDNDSGADQDNGFGENQENDYDANQENINKILNPGIHSGINVSGLSFKISNKKKSKFYLNDYFNGKVLNYREFLTNVSIVDDNGIEQYRFDLLMSNPHQEQKNMFKVTAENQFIEQLDYKYFGNKIIKLIEMLNSAEYTHIIFDMPPNSDSYTDILFDILYQHKCPFSNGCLIKPELLVVSSLDIAHFNANLEWLRLQSKNCKWKNVFLYDKGFRLVMNNLINYEELLDGTADLTYLLGTRLHAYNDAMKFDYHLKTIYYYDYDEATAFSATTDTGIVFANWDMKKVSFIIKGGINDVFN